jgi:hypothetical protein
MTNNLFKPGEAEAIVSTLEPKIRRLAAEVWEKHPNNPANMTDHAIATEMFCCASRERIDALIAEKDRRVAARRERERLAVVEQSRLGCLPSRREFPETEA